MGPQPIQLNFKFSAAVADVICHALVLTRKVISVNSDGNKMVDINILVISNGIVINILIVIVIVNNNSIVIVLALVNVIVITLAITLVNNLTNDIVIGLIKLFPTSLNKTFIINNI